MPQKPEPEPRVPQQQEVRVPVPWKQAKQAQQYAVQVERLELEGFVTVSPQQGIVVREVSVAEVADQFEIRAALEGFVVRTLAGRLAPDQVARAEANLAAQEANLGPADIPRCVTLDTEFHLLFCEFLGNQEILRVMLRLRDKVHGTILRVYDRNRGRMNSSVEEHRAIWGAIRDGDP